MIRTMTMRNHLPLLLWLLVVVVAQDDLSPHEQQLAQVKWLREQGGFFSDKLGFQPPDDVSSSGGIYALQDLKEGELLMKIPKHAQMGPPEGQPPNRCPTALRLAKAYAYEEPEFWPYVQYVFEVFPHHTVPSAWTEEGKLLVRNIMANIEPNDFGDLGFFQECGPAFVEGQPEEVLEYADAALRIVRARAWIHYLVPVYDMGNHANGHLHNMDQREDSQIQPDIEVIALRNVQKGEELSLSYNECNDWTCNGQKYEYTTAFLFNEYGFIERYSGSQRWSFYTSQDEETDFGKIVVEIHLAKDQPPSENNSTQPALELFVVQGTLGEDEIQWLSIQQRRLEGIREWVSYQAALLEQDFERDGALTLYEALLTAIRLSVEKGTSMLEPSTRDEREIGVDGASTRLSEETVSA